MTNKIPLFLISGKAEAGKTAFANILYYLYLNDGFRVIMPSFGNYVKFIAERYMGWNGKKDEQGRKLLQHVGTDLVRGKNPDFWLDSVKHMLAVIKGEYDIVLIDDVRFRNEIDGFDEDTNLFSIKIRIDRPHHISKLTREQLLHRSETELDNYTAFDYYIHNDKDLVYLNEIAKLLKFKIEGIDK